MNSETAQYWEEEIKALKRKISKRKEKDNFIAFYGSSSIRLWETMTEDLSPFEVLNLGFGGSTYGWCNHFFEEVFDDINPKEIVLYGGDNDLSEGSVSKTVGYLERLLDKILAKYPKIKISIISVKPSPERTYLEEQIISLNAKIRNITQNLPDGHYINIHSLMLDDDMEAREDLFTEDRLHMNAKGYAIWKNAVLNHLKKKVL